ncbi:hypothetical protein [Paracoccus sediminicola]|uniref:hypothetical protein n=1 Tax=Paracoccus sediminicola TaxID=3017783 RepID=UPI0022F0CA38|nr:hypothetical protein [Paracoccus sediminicola]WBU56909.1 hypothetical protein PAF18_00225 [Paracoccus sediminicola]
MGNIAALGLAEDIRVDTARVQSIVDELGQVAADGIIQMALEQMALAVTALQAAATAGDGPAIVAQADRLSRLAWQVGLVSLAAVASDVAQCARHEDRVPLTATLARAIRVANRSLTEIWDRV